MDDTTTLLVRGLNGEGPSDIVGAFINEANVDPDAIGAINLDDGTATAEVRVDVADRITQILDEGRVGTSTVSIALLDDEAEAAQRYTDHLAELVELEREEEIRRHEREIRTLSGRERENRGRALLRMRGRDEGEGLGGHHVKLMREDKGESLSDHEIRVGDLVMISKKDPSATTTPPARLRRSRITRLLLRSTPNPTVGASGRACVWTFT